uniref:F-box/LRR-repeat protein 15-like leucin rich repeat domain-containing protein n=1 Tax=Hucho hucho TaxID=62062 RepID=A0A4W5LGB8_9TELE
MKYLSGHYPSCSFVSPLSQDLAVFSLAQLLGSSLRELDLTFCQVLRYQDLQRLSLSPCCLRSVMTGLGSLASVAYHCHSLTSLELSHCPHISDQGIARGAPYLARLQHLYLSCCNALTDRSLSMLVQHCKRLRTLDISMCKRISLTTVELLQSQLPFIENVH